MCGGQAIRREKFESVALRFRRARRAFMAMIAVPMVVVTVVVAFQIFRKRR